MRIRQSIFLLVSLTMIAALVACGGSSSTTTPPPAISVTLNPAPPSSMVTGATQSLTAVVLNDSKNAGVTWSVTCGSAGACGSFSPTNTASGTATTYTAPAAIPTGNTVTVKATSVTDATKSASATITITAPLVISVALNPTPPTTLGASATQALTAVVTNDSANGGVTWSVTCGSAGACGSFNPTTTASGVATTYTAPSTVPAGNTVTVKATSVTDATKSVSATITITSTVVISVAFSPAPPTSLVVNATQLLTAVVSNDVSNGGVTWSVTCGSTGACGSFSLTTTASGVPTTYTAPAAVPTGNTVTVKATSVTDTTKSVSATITITAAPAISVAFSPAPPTSLMTGATQSLTAVVTNDTANAGVTWSVTCGSTGACGSFSPTTTASGVPTTYTAPAAVPTGNTVTVKATSVTDTTKSVSATITITAPAISVSLSGAPATLATSATALLTATVTNDSANGGVTWSVTCGSTGACGSFNPTATASGVATTYTAPSAVPTGNTVTVKATSVTDTTKSASATITITASGAPLADGSYVFYLQGTDTSPSAYFVAGQFVVSGGVITGGEQDFVDLNLDNTDLINSSGSSMATTTDGNLQIKLKTCLKNDCTQTDAMVGVTGVETLNGSLVSATRALITEFDTSATSSGSLDLQTSTAAPSAGYAFAIHGLNSGKTALAIGGIINVDGPGTISGSGSVFDINSVGTVNEAQTFNASTFTGPDSSGRVVFMLTPSSSTLREFTLVGYMVDANHIRLVEASDQLGGTTGGTALGQGANTGLLGGGIVPGDSYVIGLAGADPNGELQVAGVLTAGSSGAVSGTLSYNDLTLTAGAATVAGTYTVDATGRVKMAGVTDGTVTFNILLYIDGNGKAMAATMDPSPGPHVLAGVGYQQTAGASFTGKYVMNAIGVNAGNELDAVGPISADGVSAFTGFVDLNQISGTPTPNQTVTGAFSGSGEVLTGTITGVATSDAFAYYVVDTTKVVAIETDTKQLTLGYFELAP